MSSQSTGSPAAAGDNELTTRSDWERALAHLLAPVLSYASPGCARVRLPGVRQSHSGEESDSLEAFARSLWGAGAWLSASPTAELEVGGSRIDLAGFYRRGLVNGTNPRHPESWQPLLAIPQTLVEGAALAWNLLLAKRQLWEPLSTTERERLLGWLKEAAAIPPHDCNWRLFTVIVLTALKLLGGEYDQARIDCELDRVDAFYLGDGWYDDSLASGSGLALDYYNATVFHPYLLFWAHVDGQCQPERAARVRERARLFLERFPEWFASDGSFPCFGRSATYRCALLHAPVWGVLSSTSPLPLGQVRRLCRLALRHFMDAPGVFGPNGELTLGFTREYPQIAESYSGPGSPYWAAKAFSILALPPEHPFWIAQEVALPVERGDYTLPAAGGSFLVHGSRGDGQVQLVNGGSLVLAKKYSNFSYSTHFGYEIDRPRDIAEPDPFGEASLSFSLDGETWYGRQRAHHLGVEDGVLLTESTYGLRQPGPYVRTISAITFAGEAQVRVHRVEARRRVYAREGGFSCGWAAGQVPTLRGGRFSFASAGGRASGIRPFRGYDEACRPVLAGCNVLHPRSAVPQVRTTKARSGVFYLASVSLARPRLFAPENLLDVEPDGIGMLVERIRATGRARSAARLGVRWALADTRSTAQLLVRRLRVRTRRG
jgi:hypothetical protein